VNEARSRISSDQKHEREKPSDLEGFLFYVFCDQACAVGPPKLIGISGISDSWMLPWTASNFWMLSIGSEFLCRFPPMTKIFP